ncbi:ATP-binding protein [Niameybacter massiliensis]|uniref:histidine kinase n=1 Tax=Holtiella tumoricola TaxID=3018743 RepID=A0AA42DLJ5_9FIRM|nr:MULTISPECIES: HAMP domain-containing sensor histidine kinase [Lachnospirales]MDA3731052.1 ATP-binding protein [Holtiella tumoricola]
MSKFTMENDQFINNYLHRHLLIITTFTLLLIFLYTFNSALFISTSKFIMFVMAIYLLINSLSTRHITQNPFLSYTSIFYGAINTLQGLQFILTSILGVKVNSYYLSMATYHAGRLSFAFILVLLAYYYVHRKDQLERVSWYLMVVFILTCIVAIPAMMTDNFILFIKGNSLGALFFNLLTNLFTPVALFITFKILFPLRHQFPYTHKLIMIIFLVLASIMELIDFLYFEPLTAPRIIPYLFKISTLYLFIIGQIDCCILRPFKELYSEHKIHEKDIEDTHKELYQYSIYAKQLEHNLKAKTTHYERILSLFPEPFLLCIDDKILDTNQAALDLFHSVNKHDLTGSSLLSYLKLDDDLLEAYKQLPAHPGSLLKGETSLITLNNEIYDIEYLFTTTYLHESINIVCILRNITEKKQKALTEKALEKQNLKLSYFSNISHDIKMPINIIYSALQMQSHATTLTECLHYTDMMQANSLRLLKLINNILDVTKLENNMINFAPQIFNVVDAVETLCEMSYLYMQEKNITYVFDTDLDEKFIRTDAAAFERIIFNLLSNAIKYTPNNGELFIAIIDLNENIEIHIKDSGIGIASDKIDNIFDRFITADQGTSSKEHSCGIGLSIVRDLIHLMGGSIHCESVLGEGTTFIIQLPTPTLGDIEIDYPYQATYTSHNIKIEFCDIA